MTELRSFLSEANIALLRGGARGPIECGTTIVVILSLLALLLHPVFPARLSRLARLLITPLGLYYCSLFIRLGGFGLRQTSVVLEQIAAFFGRFAALRVLEWGLAIDTRPYTWVGFDDQGYTRMFVDTEEKSLGVPKAAEELEPEPETLNRKSKKKDSSLITRERMEDIRTRMAANDTPICIILSTAHLILSLRGIGYAFAPPRRSLAPPPHLSFDLKRPAPFIATSLLSIFLAAASASGGVALTRWTPKMVEADLLRWFPSIPSLVLDYFAVWPVGVGAFFLIIGLSNLSLQVVAYADLVMREASRRLPGIPKSLRLAPFDPREYPPMFQTRLATSVSQAWSECWHQLVARPFRALALNPVMRIFKAVVGRDFARAMGLLASFALSAWLHEDYIPRTDATFWARYGSWIYFALQAMAIISEQMFTKWTGRKVRGWVGLLWTVLFSILSGALRLRAASVL
ncbi:BQ2448_4949 [Microbotryum intermedium]|uniref:BQ2448_4949 protein n=1 Tax=Microbotryum intermedium TaxID=269621 RepID=A0A238FGE5_9BASI|nr:BQ2448_4949 [Microbotryum intermedium]